MHRTQTVDETRCPGLGEHQLSQPCLRNSPQALRYWMIDDNALMRCYAQITMYRIPNYEGLSQSENPEQKI
jgi:hypothetical protein